MNSKNIVETRGNKMKKLFAVLLSLCLMCGVLTACGGGEASSNDNNSDGTQAVNIANFDGWWTAASVDAGAFKINASDSTVTAYAKNGYKIATFPCVAKTDGVELKMGAFGNVTVALEDLTVSAEPTVSEQVDIQKKWVGPLNTEQYLEFNANGFKLFTTSEDYGTKYEVSADKTVVSFMGTKDLLSKKHYQIVGGGLMLIRVEGTEGDYKPSQHNELFIDESALATDKGKAIGNYYIFLTEKWADETGENTAEFADNGKFSLSGTEMGIWYPTATGAAVELADGTVDEVTLSDGSFTMNTTGTTYTKK